MALTTFGTHISYAKSDELSLRRLIRRRDGEYIWSIIPEVHWNAVLERHGEEIGVFLPRAYPEEISYQKVSNKRDFRARFSRLIDRVGGTTPQQTCVLPIL